MSNNATSLLIDPLNPKPVAASFDPKKDHCLAGGYLCKKNMLACYDHRKPQNATCYDPTKETCQPGRHLCPKFQLSCELPNGGVKCYEPSVSECRPEGAVCQV